MSFLGSAARRIVGLFVTDWLQSGVVVAIVALAWLATSRLGGPVIAVFVLLLAGQLVWFAVSAARSTR